MGMMLGVVAILGWILICKYGVEASLRALLMQNLALAAVWSIAQLLDQRSTEQVVIGSLAFFAIALGASWWLKHSDSVLVAIVVMALGTAALFLGVPALQAGVSG